MIVAKPKIGTIFSLSLFIAICLSVAGATAYYMLNSTQIAWYQYALVLILFPLGLGLATKVILGYKIVRMGKDKIDISFPSRFKQESYKLRDINYWKETIVKTATGTYKELEIAFSNKKQLTLSYQEHTDYTQVIKYLKKKCSKKMRSS